MARPRTALAAVAPEPDPADAVAPPQPSPVAAVEPAPAPEQPQRTPERQRLAVAIEARQAVAAAITGAEVAVDGARRADLDASTAFYAAQRAFDRAQPGYRPGRAPTDEYERQEWYREQNLPPLPIGEARAAYEAAKDAKDTARRALEFHQGRLDQLTDSASYRRWDAENAAKAAAAADPAVSAVLAEARRRYLAYVDAQRLVETLQCDGVISRQGPGWNTPPSFHDLDAWPLTGAWRAALAQLAADPDTPLPAV